MTSGALGVGVAFLVVYSGWGLLVPFLVRMDRDDLDRWLIVVVGVNHFVFVVG